MIVKEVFEGRLIGPCQEPPVLNLRVSPLEIVPKKTLGEFHLRHHLSYPKRDCVNDAIPHEWAIAKYISFGTAMREVSKYGLKSELAKCNIQLFACCQFTQANLIC